MSGAGVARSAWGEFLDSYARQHEGWLASLEGPLASDGRGPHGPLRPLHGAHLLDDGAGIELTFGEGVRYLLARPTRLESLHNERGEDVGLRIEGADGVTTLRFRTAAAPEMLDGLAPPAAHS